jgi:hypothetical protein
VWLPAVATEVALTYEEPDDHPLIAFAEHRVIVSPGRKT